MKRTARTLLPLALGAALLAPLAPSASALPAAGDRVQTASAPAAASASTVEAAAYSRDTTIARAKRWLTANNGSQVPYSQVNYWNGWRQDCSGYVSMALQLGKPGTNTVGLASSTYTYRIKMRNLKKGDLVIDPVGSSTSRHVVIFHKWANDTHTRYGAYEQRGGHGTDHRRLSYGIGQDQYDAYRPKKY